MKELDFSFKDILDVEQRQGGKIRRGKITIPAKVIKPKPHVQNFVLTLLM